ncbi:carboxymuconolactone decarboxylase family protein [Actinocorallia longicatena]|uniref:Alkyl hydroperoxide reductase AhpD n=1 Tax=Actinocorallia longicatena TaxID=111803 RepID=A0ABP6QIN5_9ACTN
MSLDSLTSALPPYARDIRLNLGSVTTTSRLSEQRLWGTVVATALATRSAEVIAAVTAEARDRLTAEAFEAAKAANAVMAMNNVYYRSTHLIGDEAYTTLPAGLRMSVIGRPGVDRTDFELWCLAVSAVNGCGRCLESHERVLREGGLGRELVQEALRIAAVVNATAAVLESERALATL